MESNGFYFNKDKEKFKSKVQTICREDKFYYYCAGGVYTNKQKRHGDLDLPKEIFVLIAPKELVSW